MSLVLKSIPHGRLSAVTGFLPSMERAWAVGHRLALYCNTPSGGTMHQVLCAQLFGMLCCSRQRAALLDTALSSLA